MSNWRKLKIYCALFVTVLLASCAGNGQGEYLLLVRSQDHSEEYVRETVRVGDQIEVSWIHSVELTPWIEILEVSDNQQLVLTEVRFQSFGAGVPHDSEGEVQMINGYTVLTGLERPFEQYRWIHSQQSKLTLRLNGDVWLQPEDVSHHQRVEMYLEKR